MSQQGECIDLFWSGVVPGEAKSLGAVLEKAFHRTLDYLAGGSIGRYEGLEFVLVTDFGYIQLTKFGDNAWEQIFTADELPDHLDQLIPPPRAESLSWKIIEVERKLLKYVSCIQDVYSQSGATRS